jgi:CheY-like chemotaxis protein
MITSEEFLLHLRSALNHLYDPYFLQKSPLVRLFGLGDQPDTPSALQRILNDAISALEPTPGDPNPAENQRNYELIMYRYVQQFGQDEVANQLGLSVRHLRRQQNAAIYSLGAYLWEQFQLSSKPFVQSEQVIEDAQPGSDESENGSELDWLKDMPLDEPALMDQVLPAVLDLSQPLAEKHRVELITQIDQKLPPLAVQAVALRQLFLNILSVAVPLSPGGRVEISARTVERAVEVHINCRLPAGSARPTLALKENNLEMAEKIAKICGGSLICSIEVEPFWALLVIPAYHQRTVLVIDDNTDFIQLIQRNITGTHYRVVGERDAERGLALAEEIVPDIILLDVMMPRVDGWETLSRLRRHPKTSHIPVIICTILAQEELALSLGAKDFLRKPVSRERVLSALERQAALLEQESR